MNEYLVPPPRDWSATKPATNTTRDQAVPFADSTQTVRALSQPELDDASQPRWYVVQLVVSDRLVNLETMPRLEVFATHRLYSVSRQQSTPQHALRLGFFSEEASAKVVCGYLRTFYASATVVRISAAEQARFAGPPRTTEVDVNGAANVMKAAVPPARPAIQRPVADQGGAVIQRSAPGAAGQRLKKPKSLREELLEEARQIQMSKTGKFRLPKRKDSWLSRLLGLPKR